MLWVLAALVALAIAGHTWTSIEESRQRTRQLELQLDDVRELRGDVRTLVESVTRQSQTPVIFRQPEPRSSAGWLDGQPELRVRAE